MALSTRQTTVILIVASQIPILLLLVIFLNIPSLPFSYRVAGVGIVICEAALLSELIGNIVQKVRATESGILVRGVFERKRIPWSAVTWIEQVVVSPLHRGSTAMPSKLFLVKTMQPAGLENAESWWVKAGPVANRRKGMLDLVEKYDAYTRKRLRGWHILWRVDYKNEQQPHDEVEVEYLVLDGREKAVIDDFARFGGHHARQVQKVQDLTYLSFVKTHGGKYSHQPDHIWETVQ